MTWKSSLVWPALLACAICMVQAQTSVSFDSAVPLNDYISLGEFQQNDNQEGWTSASGESNPILMVREGVLRMVTTGHDPYAFRSGLKNIPATFTKVQVRLRRVSGATTGWGVYFGTTQPGQSGFSAQRAASFAVPNDLEHHLLEFDLSRALNGYAISDFRIDPGPEAVNVVEIDHVRVGRVSLDTDGDGLPDNLETGTGHYANPRNTGTKPTANDTDGDGVADGIEVSLGSDPTNPADTPGSMVKYESTNATYVIGQAIPSNRVSLTTRPALSFVVTPQLPDGLELDAKTGSISGTPTTLAKTADHVVNATLAGGIRAEAVLRISVRNPHITYPVGSFTFHQNQTITGLLPVVHGPAPKNYSIQPPLPRNLAIDRFNGKISGAVPAYAPGGHYVLTAAYDGYPEATAEVDFLFLGGATPEVDPSTPLAAWTSLGEFDEASDLAAVSYQVQVSSPVLRNGALALNTLGTDPYFGLRFSLKHDFRVLEFRLKVTAGSPNPFQVFWTEDTSGRRQPNDTSSHTANWIRSDGAFHTYRLDLTKSSEARLTSIRLDPGAAAGVGIEIDYIRIGSLGLSLATEAQPDGALRISWPETIGYTLQSTSSLPGGWAEDFSAIQDLGSDKALVVPANGAARFWRLVK